MQTLELAKAGSEMNELDDKIDRLSDYTQAEFKAVRAEIGGLREEMHAEFKSVRTEMKEEFAAVRAEMREEFAAVRAEMKDEFRAVRAEMKEEFKAVRSELRATIKDESAELRAEIGSLRDRMEVRFDALQRSILWLMGTMLVVVASILASSHL